MTIFIHGYDKAICQMANNALKFILKSIDLFSWKAWKGHGYLFLDFPTQFGRYSGYAHWIQVMFSCFAMATNHIGISDVISDLLKSIFRRNKPVFRFCSHVLSAAIVPVQFTRPSVRNFSKSLFLTALF